MLQPTGPLPPEIYWRRRLFAIAVLITALVLLLWLVMSMSGGGHSAHTTAATTSTAAPADGLDGAVAESPSAAPSTTNAPPTSSAVPTSAGAPAPAAVATGPCTDQSLAVKVAVDQPTYQVGQQPVFQIVITNIATGACQRDLSQQQVLVYTLDGQHRLWSNTDCYPAGAPNIQTFNPGQQAAFRVTWAGSTSQPGCQGDRVPVQPGAYSVVAQLGAIRSAPEPFNVAG